MNSLHPYCERDEGFKTALKHADFHLFVYLSISLKLSTKIVLFIVFLCITFASVYFPSRQALQQYKGDAATVVTEIINTIEGGPPVDVSSVRSM